MSNSFNHTLSSNYPVDAYITIHYQNIRNNTSVNDTPYEDDKNIGSASSISSIASSPSTPRISPVSISPSLHVIETVLNISNQYPDDTNYNHTHNYIPPKTKKYPILTDLEQCRNMTDSIQPNYNDNHDDDDDDDAVAAATAINNHSPVIKPLVRRFTEPVYVNRSIIDSLAGSSINHIDDQSYSPQIPCTRHHHRRNTIAIKFNKPLYKEYFTNK